jgi:hypothetical protein
MSVLGDCCSIRVYAFSMCQLGSQGAELCSCKGKCLNGLQSWQTRLQTWLQWMHGQRSNLLESSSASRLRASSCSSPRWPSWTRPPVRWMWSRSSNCTRLCRTPVRATYLWGTGRSWRLSTRMCLNGSRRASGGCAQQNNDSSVARCCSMCDRQGHKEKGTCCSNCCAPTGCMHAGNVQPSVRSVLLASVQSACASVRKRLLVCTRRNQCPCR